MEQSYRKYLSFSQQQLRTKLERLRDKMTPLERSEILQAVGEERKRLRSVQAKKKTLDGLWHEVLQPLHIELRTVEVLRRYKTRNYPVPERDRAMTEYSAVLQKAKRLLTQYHKAYDMTPLRLAREKNVPNNGEHWSDWIPQPVKEKITALFAAIPHRPKAKVKIPFERKERKADWSQDRLRLTRKVEEELNAAHKDLANDPDEYDNEYHREYISRLELATKALAAWEEDTPLPRTWQAMFGNKLYDYAVSAGTENGSA